MINTTLKNKMLTYIATALAASTYSTLKVYGPNVEPPDLETAVDPMLLIDIDDVGNKQFTLGSRSTRKTGFVTVTLLVKEGQGINFMSGFKGFMDGIGLYISDGITYKAPVEIMSPAKFKGWEPTCIALPYQLDNNA